MSCSILGHIVGAQRHDVCKLWDTIGTYSSQLFANNLVMGIPDPEDTILHHQIICRSYRWFVRRKELVSYPPPSGVDRKAKITGIAVIDMKANGKGGDAVIETGGVGSHRVDIKLTSALFRGFRFQIIIIGKTF